MGIKSSKNYQIINIKPKGSLIKEKCHNKENIFGDELETKDGVVIIILPTNNKYIAYCYQYDELIQAFGDRGKTYFKEPYSGIMINKSSYNLSLIFTAFMAKDTNTKDIKNRSIYELRPINFNKFVSGERITEEDLDNFEPTDRDYNPIIFPEANINENIIDYKIIKRGGKNILVEKKL